MCFCFPWRKKAHAPPDITPPPKPPLQPSYTPRPIYIQAPPAATLPITVTTTTIQRSYQPILPISSKPSYPPYQPTFPLNPRPSCRHCHCTPHFRSTVASTNENGNGGRPYYVCIQCKTNAITKPGPKGKGWITWDDSKGVKPGNPICNCGFITRQDHAGVNSYAPGQAFWTCSTGACGYISWWPDGRTD